MKQLDNKIYEYLKAKGSKYINNIDSLYKLSEEVLGHIPSFFSNYTLHDISHSSRVIHHSSFFLEEDLSLYSDLHLAMIIYAGLMHDYGMYVSELKHKEIEHFLEERNDKYNEMSPDEKYLCEQNYLRDIHADRVKEVVNESASLKDSISNILSYDHSYDISEEIYKICASHTKDCEWILDNLDSERTYGNEIINPAHIAILLRLGDCLDIDAQRAPVLLCELLHIKGYSKEEWNKHLPISNYDKVTTHNSLKIIRFDGETNDPDIYRNTEDYIDWIRSEIPKINGIVENYDSPFCFEIDRNIIDTIKTIGFTKSEYNFTLSYDKLSKLLMGEHIYGSKQVGLRELLQNAIDAIQTMKALYDKDSSHDFPYYPSIIITFDKVNNTLSISDNGTGMSKKILKDYFFNIGNSFYSSKAFAEINCGYKPIGHFGIGFLACFMLSEKVSLITKHYESNDAIKLEFERDTNFSISRKVGKKEYSEEHGTKIILQYDQIIGEIFKDEDELIRYVKKTILPNGFNIIFKAPNNTSIDIFDKVPFQRFPSSNNESDMEIYYDIQSIPDIIDCCESLMAHDEEIQLFVNTDMPYIDNLMDSCFLISELSSYIDLISEKFTIFEMKTILSEGKSLPLVKNQEFSANLASTVEHILVNSTITINKSDSAIDYLHKSIIRTCYNDEHINYIRVPFISDKKALSGFIKDEKKHGYNNASRIYSDYINYFSILGINKKDIADDQLINLVNYIVDIFGGDADYNLFSNYPFDLCEINQEVISSPKSSLYLPIEHNKLLDVPQRSTHIYVRGIRVTTIPIILPITISGLALNKLLVNLNGSRYELDVSRDKFTHAGIAAFSAQFAKNLFATILKTRDSENISDEEIELWNIFLSKYIHN